jgi:hypothetical protein
VQTRTGAGEPGSDSGEAPGPGTPADEARGLCRADLEVNTLRRILERSPLAGDLLSEAELEASLQDALASPHRQPDVWLFAYGSLIWNPVLEFDERLVATVHGYHRSFCLWSRVNRGTWDRPGLVLGMDRGGRCTGVAYRVPERLAEYALRFPCRKQPRVDPGRFQPLLLARYCLALARERFPPQVIHRAQPASNLGKTQVGVVFAQAQPILGAAREHPVRLRNPARDEIVDQHAQIRLVAPRTPCRALSHVERRVDARQEALRRGFLVAGGAVDLAGKEQSRDRPGFERALEPARIEIVVFNRVAGPRDLGVGETADRTHQLALHVERQAR